LNAIAQLTDGTIAPDFTLTDYCGNTHHLYSYLDSGKKPLLRFLLRIVQVAGITTKRKE